MKFIDIKELLQKLDNYDYTAFHVHHTWKPSHKHFKPGTHIQMQKNMRRHHVSVNGWSDIGQHISVFPDGKIVTGRDFGRNPVSISSHNNGAFAMEMVGDFDKGQDELKGAQLKMVMLLTKYFMDRGIKIVFHRDHSYKTCPGSGINKPAFVKVASEIHNIQDWGLDAWWEATNKGITDGSRPNEGLTRLENIVIQKRLGRL